MQAPSSAFVFAGIEKGRQARRDIVHREKGYEEENFRQSVRLHGFWMELLRSVIRLKSKKWLGGFQC
jgi:hypothetical protein